jgi:hypothetical protein
MITAFSKIVLAVPDLVAATAEYKCLLGSSPLALRNVEIVLEEDSGVRAPAIKALALLDEGDELAAQPAIDQLRGLQLPVDRQRTVSGLADATDTGICAVDHIVLMTNDADDCIRLFGEHGLGMRLALDQLVPKWGGRMLFFRCGKMTLEVIHNIEEPPPRDRFWGITYLCEDLDYTLAQLDNNGVNHSEIRTGRKPGTRVASVSSHNLGIPTLLIEPANS